MKGIPTSAYRAGTKAISVLLVVIGLAIIAQTVANGGGPLAYGSILGVLFTALGLGRLYMLRK